MSPPMDGRSSLAAIWPRGGPAGLRLAARREGASGSVAGASPGAAASAASASRGLAGAGGAAPRRGADFGGSERAGGGMAGTGGATVGSGGGAPADIVAGGVAWLGRAGGPLGAAAASGAATVRLEVSCGIDRAHPRRRTRTAPKGISGDCRLSGVRQPVVADWISPATRSPSPVFGVPCRTISCTMMAKGRCGGPLWPPRINEYSVAGRNVSRI
jgi:hypothetical protein